MDKFGKAFIAGENSPSTGFHVAGCRDLRDSINRIFESLLSTVLQEALFMLYHLALITTLQGRYYYSNFTDEKAVAYRS